MADAQPGSLFQFERPGTSTPVKSEEVRNNFNALGTTNRTDDEAFPETKRDGMPRFNVSDLDNVRLEFWFDTAWRTVLQKIQLGFPAPAKQEVRFDPAQGPVWSIDHNLGSRPLVQVYDLAGTLLQQVTLNPVPRDVIAGPHLSPAILTSLPAGPTTLWTWVATFRGAVAGLIAEVREGLTGGSGDVTFEVAINGTPTTGGQLQINTTPLLGDRLAGGVPSAANTFEPGDTVTVQATVVGLYVAGALKFTLDAERRLQDGQYLAQHSTENRVIITHSASRTGFVLLIG